ncbi:iron complex transport system ATP-binding protein [Nonomuraea polychroma]|uniref:Iron complex transport system ATP-binding protein n=1 Tax=Nonomuraea polychroma TaxID=46176 RepID=A0A438M6F4_9ACTN|nr:ABC transporter ATP-binding protein [Nonomuraea polychroma]RVX41280.1 iron complex transport system ATP-binding protein [Nonomuraea polychroma]
MSLLLDDISLSIDGATIVQDLALAVEPRQVVGLIGPNGSGKTTALRCVYRALRPTGGAVWIDGKELTRIPLRDSARVIAALTQDGRADLDFTVEEIVALGRAPHLRGNQALSARELELCRQAMAQMQVLHLAHRGVLSLSGGERQRVLVARALVQEPQVLVLDEPTNHLDLHHQIRLLSMLKDSGLSVLVTLHDLNLAASACDRLAVLSQGSLVASGPPQEVLTEALLRDVFGVEASIVPHPLTAVPQILYDLGSATPREGTPA